MDKSTTATVVVTVMALKLSSVRSYRTKTFINSNNETAPPVAVIFEIGGYDGLSICHTPC